MPPVRALPWSVNHLKSKGSDCDDVGDPDLGDGQGNCSQTRRAAAEALVDWLATDPTGSGDPDFLIMGDLNSYAQEDTIDEIKAGSDDTAGTGDDFTNLISHFQGAYAYSYTFDGQAGYLDHALANASLFAQITGAADWHINSDEPDVLDYDTTFKPPAQDALYEVNAYRTSDHDPVVVGLDPQRASHRGCGWTVQRERRRLGHAHCDRLRPERRYASPTPGISTTTARSRPPGQSVTFSARRSLLLPATYTVKVQVTDSWRSHSSRFSDRQRHLTTSPASSSRWTTCQSLNTVKAGQAIPVKFSLGGNKGLNIFAAGYPKSEKIACDTAAPLDDIEQTVTAGNSSLSYSAGNDQYNYVWKTEKSWAGTCRQLVVKLIDGTVHQANFKFK